MVYQFMENGTLDSKLQDLTSPLNWKQRANIAVGVARGLRYLHDNNIFHGDIKATNILLDEYLEPKIGDFGIAHFLFDQCQQITPMIDQSKIAGTPHHWPHWYVEGYRGIKVKLQIDVFSYGKLLLELVPAVMDSKDTAPFDEEKRRFYIEIIDDHEKILNTQVDWAKIFFDIGEQCKLDDKTQREELFKDFSLQISKKNDVTMETIHECLEKVYVYYRIHLGTEKDENAIDLTLSKLSNKSFLRYPYVMHQFHNFQLFRGNFERTKNQL